MFKLKITKQIFKMLQKNYKKSMILSMKLIQRLLKITVYFQISTS
jgi:hypothetical protein